MDPAPPLILASVSPRRSELLASTGLAFTVIPSQAEEIHDERLPVTAVCSINAIRKAEEVARREPESVIIGADTLVALNGRIYGKPKDLSAAACMLRELSGKTHEVITAVSLQHWATGRKETFADRTEVSFRSLSDELIREYATLVSVLDKAGAYGIQERGEMLVAAIRGSFSNVMGLPLERLCPVLETWGYKPRMR